MAARSTTSLTAAIDAALEANRVALDRAFLGKAIIRGTDWASVVMPARVGSRIPVESVASFMISQAQKAGIVPVRVRQDPVLGMTIIEGPISSAHRLQSVLQSVLKESKAEPTEQALAKPLRRFINLKRR